MKATKITLQIVKNLGNYETCRLEIEAAVQEGEDVQVLFEQAKAELEKAYENTYKPKPILSTKSLEFERVCKALHEGKTDIKQLERLFNINQDAMSYFNQHKLI